jgi:hypothetical protein
MRRTGEKNDTPVRHISLCSGLTHTRQIKLVEGMWSRLPSRHGPPPTRSGDLRAIRYGTVLVRMARTSRAMTYMQRCHDAYGPDPSIACHELRARKCKMKCVSTDSRVEPENDETRRTGVPCSSPVDVTRQPWPSVLDLCSPETNPITPGPRTRCVRHARSARSRRSDPSFRPDRAEDDRADWPMRRGSVPPSPMRPPPHHGA